MKIYHKKSFFCGMGFLALAILNLLLHVLYRDVDMSAWALIGLLFIIGLSALARGLAPASASKAHSDKRSQMLYLYTQGKAFKIMQTISLVMIFALVALGKLLGHGGFVAVGVGLAVLFSILLFAELFACIYYEFKN